MGNGLISDWYDVQYLFLYLKKKGYGDKKLRYDIFNYFHGTDFMNDKDIVKIVDDDDYDYEEEE